MEVIPRIHQKEAFEAVTEYIRLKGDGHPLVALPTGSGKSLVIAMLCRYFTDNFYTVVVVSHVKEILEQNYEAIKSTCEHVGLHSAMLGSRTKEDVTVAGIQSIYKSPIYWGGTDIVIVDEAHRTSTDEGTMYQKFFDGIGKHNRIGLTATPFRLKGGWIFGPGKMFTERVCNWCTPEKHQKLIDLKYLAPLTMKRTKMEMDVSDIKLVGGDYNEKQLADKFDREPVTNAAIKEILAAGKNRNKWLVFAIDIDHAEHIAETLNRNGVKSIPIHSKMHELGFCRSASVQGIKYGDYTCGVSVNVLTTGFDSPKVDLLAILRPSNSASLHGQILGRGSRYHKDKKNCLVLDFAGNCLRLGSIDNLNVVIKGKGAATGEPILKACPGCDELVPTATKICTNCFHAFEFEHHLNPSAAFEAVKEGKERWLKVKGVSYSLNSGFGSPSSMSVTYDCGGMNVKEVICVEHKGFAKQKADHWIKYRGGNRCRTAKEALSESKTLNIPKSILVTKKGRYHVIKDATF